MLLSALTVTFTALVTVHAPPAHATTGCTVTAWGTQSGASAMVPSRLTDVVQVAAGVGHGLALKSDGTVVAWGDTDDVPALPSGLTDVVQVAAGVGHGLALKSDGTVVAWGSNAQDQTAVPSDLTDVVRVAAGSYHSLALKSDGTVVAWGFNASGQATVPSGLTDVVQVAAGHAHSLALKSDGTVVAWGSNAQDQTAVPSGLTDVVQVAGGSNHSLAVTSDGTVVAWGYPNDSIDVPSGLTDVVQVAAGTLHSLALKSDGTVVAWGHHSYGQTAVPSGLTGVIQIDSQSTHSVALSCRSEVEFQHPAMTVAEETATIQLPVTRTGTAAATTVDYAVTGGSAVAGSDFTFTPGTLRFAPGESTKTIALAIRNDATPEAAETIRITLSSPSSGSDLGSAASMTVTITASDHPVGFARTTLTVAENASTLRLPVIRTGAAAATTVDYAVTGGSAVAGSDFTFTPGTLRFAPGESTKTIALAIRNDATPEAAETIRITLSSPSSGSDLGSAASMTVTITASDQQPDALISSGGGYVGNNIYNTTAAAQSKTTAVRWSWKGATRSFSVRIYNDGNAPAVIALKGSRASSGSAIGYYAGSTNVTAALQSASGWRVSVAPRSYRLIRIQLHVAPGVRAGTRSAAVSGTWVGDGSRVDLVKAAVTVTR
ncbi:hypothetical protein HS041_28025 [Planomonospora sp. ID67723]|uniref:Calx-beta domain-containing protein n=1 Tax=Planomonospora sp. ID67723 TaxID=2738134 RepID=UPI0018C3C482|nr:Calx-beta domain-containing protein [Planomonospora sp. ID67723]MBG0831585.1 hypothetical protein [Planomonospora sp. ID67723]